MTRSPHKSMSMNWRMSRRGSDKSVNELIDRICQLACHAQIGDGSDATNEFEVHCRQIQAIPDANIELWKELLKVNHDKKVSDLLEISCTYYAIELGVAAMCGWQGHLCPPPRLSTSEEQATEEYPRVSQLHPLTLCQP